MSSCCQASGYRQCVQLEVEPDIRQEVLAQSAQLMTDIDYQRGLEKIRQQMGDSGEEAGGVKEEV